MHKNQLITTIKERCKVCYTCVRECPGRAIRINGGQAEVINERCIGCGNCTVACKQEAKQYYKSYHDVLDLLNTSGNVVACIAPSFPAEFTEYDHRMLVGMIKRLGFWKVVEVGFGADLVSRKMKDLLDGNPESNYISTTCPAVFRFVKVHMPDLTESLAPIVSPMVATARVIKEKYGSDIKVVFIGPCIAKKYEVWSKEVTGELSEAITFNELREIFDLLDITPAQTIPSEFDSPLSGKGVLFPLSGGMNQSINEFEDFMNNNLVVAQGRSNFIQALKEFESGELDTRCLDLLCCNGCIMGAGMGHNDSYFKKRQNISRFAVDVISKRDKNEHANEINNYYNLDYSRCFIPNDQRIPEPTREQIDEILRRTGKITEKDEYNCGACGYETCREHAVAIALGFAESEMCLPFTLENLHRTVRTLGVTNNQLISTREALAQSEKLASMGQLSAGIAHELNNPLGVVLMYSNILLDEIDQKQHLWEDISIIAHEANRCKKIVSGLLNFARQNKLNLNSADSVELVEQCIKLTDVPKNIEIEIIDNIQNPELHIDRDQIIQVLNNLIGNAFTAMNNNGKLTIIIDGDDDVVTIKVKDNGSGITEDNLTKVFQPFFTTKTMGKGTGLGLAVSYGIIKMHKGTITVESNANPDKGQTGTIFTIMLPRMQSEIIENNF
jgi:signal transduction histidine kinase/iron only hydrogenase large subunit-like protein